MSGRYKKIQLLLLLLYFLRHMSVVLGATEETVATWRHKLVDMWSLNNGQEFNRTKCTRVDYIQVRGRGLT